jgi:hypothetical protein
VPPCWMIEGKPMPASTDPATAITMLLRQAPPD